MKNKQKDFILLNQDIDIFYIDECPYCHHIIIWGIRENREEAVQFFCPFCERFLNRTSHPEEIREIPPKSARDLLPKLREKEVLDIDQIEIKINERAIMEKEKVQERSLEVLKRIKNEGKIGFKDLLDFFDYTKKELKELIELLSLNSEIFQNESGKYECI
jgi:predicted RNA-binding Zn-ribbon protein involved in translation (DUF1610 family)